MKIPKPTSKVKKIVPIMAISLAFLLTLGTRNVYATTYDLQQYSTCVNGQCSLTVDVSTLGLNTARINNLKTVNITNFLNKSGIINNFQYSWSGNVLTITGTVNSNVYWSFGAGGDVFDPWWNYTAQVNSTTYVFSPALVDNGVNADDYSYRGIFMSLGTNLTMHFKKHHDSTATILRIYNSAGTNTENLTFSGDWAVKTNMSAGSYYIFVNLTQGSTHMFQYTPYTFPNTNGSISVLAGAIKRQSGALANYTAYWFEIEQIMSENMTSQNYTVWYTTNLYLNGTEANFSGSNNTALPIFAQTNLTGLNVSIFVNDSLKNSSLTSCNYTSFLPSGLYNVTAWIGNSSTNSTITYWANMTYTASQTPSTNATFTYNFDLNNAPLTCVNTSFAQRNATVDNSFHQEVYPCPYGCDNNTNTGCSPPPYQQNLIIIFIFGIIAIIVYWLFK